MTAYPIPSTGGQLLHPLAGAGAVLSLAGGIMAAASTGNAGPDYAGIAALVASVTGLVSAIGALIIGLRRKDSRDMSDQLAELWLREHGDEKPMPGHKKPPR